MRAIFVGPAGVAYRAANKGLDDLIAINNKGSDLAAGRAMETYHQGRVELVTGLVAWWA